MTTTGMRDHDHGHAHSKPPTRAFQNFLDNQLPATVFDHSGQTLLIDDSIEGPRLVHDLAVIPMLSEAFRQPHHP